MSETVATPKWTAEELEEVLALARSLLPAGMPYPVAPDVLVARAMAVAENYFACARERRALLRADAGAGTTP